VAHVEARVAIAALLVSMALMTGLTARWGFSRILGLGHIVAWLPLLWFLAARLSEAPAVDAFGFWIRTVIALNAASLAIDIVDVVRFLAGDRSETVSLDLSPGEDPVRASI
jgi:Na+/melibiose symporter-like transporter